MVLRQMTIIWLKKIPYFILYIKYQLKSESEITQSCLTVYDPKDYTVHEILQVRILE